MRRFTGLQFTSRGSLCGRRTAAAVLVVGAMTMTACGDENLGTRSGTAPSESVSPSGSATDADLERRAKSHFLPDDAFPDPWRLSQPPQPGFGLTVCGVDIEPEDPRGSARRRFAQSPVGPFLSQYVQVHRDGLADQVVSQVAAALPSCTSFETKGESPTSPTTRFAIDEVAFADVPANAVLWRMTSQGERQVTQDIALVADGEFLIGFVSYATGKAPDPAVITTAVNALPQGD